MNEAVVRIIEDCRNTDKPATGQLGMYEGDFNRTVIVKRLNGITNDYELKEFMYDWWMESGWTEYYPEYTGQQPEPAEYWMPITNPRIRLADGSHIWGDECWWSPKIDASMAELQKEVDLFREVYAAMIEAEAQSLDQNIRS